MARLISEINPKINLRDLVGLILVMMHPGPMNRGIEIESAIADGERSVITEQVEMGVAVREAVLHLLAGGRS